MLMRDICPQCQSPKSTKNGHIPNGKQNYQGKDCGRQFVDCCAHYLVSDATRALIERLLGERIALRGIGRATGVTLTWLLGLRVECFEAWPDHLHVAPLTCPQDVLSQRLTAAADAMATCVPKKANKPWIWLAMDAKTRQVMAVHVGDRSRTSAKRLWVKIPRVDRQHATLYTAPDVVSNGVMPAAQHRALSTLARQTNPIERFNQTLRQRVARLVRDAWSCSKKLAHHIGTLKRFSCHDNLTRAAA